MPTVLIIEDDESMRILMCEKLGRKYDVLSAYDGLDALDVLSSKQVDLIIADIMMPRMDGYEFVKTLRNLNLTTPIIMVTAKQSFNDKKDGFAVGADDYMTKPVNFDELEWRIDALLRRAKIALDKKIELGEFCLNATTFEVMYKGKQIELAKKEFELIFKLLSYPNRLFSKDKLMNEIWGYDSPSDDTTIRTHINRLRNKFEDIKEFEIVTIKGLGYKAVVKNNE